jgi:ParB family chromosome partitioning protein
MQVSITSVTIKDRVRKDIGDLTSLMDSMRKYGQLTPILLTRQHELIAGHRRLLSAKQLGWYAIEATYVDREDEADKLEIELVENIQRKDFSTDELIDGLRKLDKLRRPGPVRRLVRFFHNLFARLFRRKARPRLNRATHATAAGQESEGLAEAPAQPMFKHGQGRKLPDDGDDVVIGIG